MIITFQDKIRNILTLCQAIKDCKAKWDSPEYKATDLAFWNAIKDLDEEAGKGVQIGRLVKFPVNDAYAWYIITKISKNIIKVAHIPYNDGYRYSGVSMDGEISRREVENIIDWVDSIKDKS